MAEFDPLERIRSLCRERQWSIYQLAKASGIAYSTLNTLLNSKNMPSLPTLQKICGAFGISMADFFHPQSGFQHLTADQEECMTLFTALSPEDKKLAIAYLKGLAKKL